MVKKCYVCGVKHTRRSKYCSKRCEWHYKKHFKKVKGTKYEAMLRYRDE